MSETDTLRQNMKLAFKMVVEQKEELTQLRSDLARAGGEIQRHQERYVILQGSHDLLVKERDTLKAECERRGRTIHRLCGGIKRLRVQLTQAEEAKKLTAVQMMALEGEREAANAAAEQMEAALKDAAEEFRAQLTTSREAGHRQAFKIGAELGLTAGTLGWSEQDYDKASADCLSKMLGDLARTEFDAEAYAEVIEKLFDAESSTLSLGPNGRDAVPECTSPDCSGLCSQCPAGTGGLVGGTLPRTYEQGAEAFKKVAVEFFYWWHNQPGSNTEQGFDDWWAIRALPATPKEDK